MMNEKNRELTVNGKVHLVRGNGNTPLLYILRNEIGLNSPRFGCGLGQCGACTVLVDGRAVQSCNLPVSRVLNKKVTTLEGLGTAEAPHPVQKAFLEMQAAQCGYCSNGMIMSAFSLLVENPKPTDAQIRRALDGNLCRCGSHLRIIRAVARAAEFMEEEAQ